jgi:GNAT superfamily N-acetyltransferase
MHRVDLFDSGEPSLDRWLAESAGQSERRNATRTYVLAWPNGRVGGYVTVAAAQVAFDSAIPAVSRGLSRHFPVPVALIARLAADRSVQRQNRGTQLVNFALERCLVASAAIGIRAVVVDATSARAAEFYRRFGFESADHEPLRLMVRVDALRDGLAD